MKTINIAIAGLGTVGSGLVTILNESADHILKQTDTKINIVAVADLTFKNKDILPDSVTHLINDPLEFPDNYDVLVELMGGIDLAYYVCKMALSKGKSVVTANKAMLAIYGKELAEIAQLNNATLGIEAAIAGGVPLVKTIRESFIGSPITKVEGILNGSCNYILTKMEDENISYDQALKEAQEKGYAEKDPSLDVDGIDTAHKINILAKLAFAQHLKMEDMEITGISNVTLDDVNILHQLGMRIKLIGTLEKVSEDSCICTVKPKVVRQTRPFSEVKGTLNLVKIFNDSLEQIVLAGHGAGMKPTGNSILCDIVDIAKGTKYNTFAYPISHIQEAKIVQSTTNLHYLVRINNKIDDELIEKEYFENNTKYVLTVPLCPTKITDLFNGNTYYELHEPLHTIKHQKK